MRRIHILTSISIVVAVLSLVPVCARLRTRAAGVAPPSQADLQGLLGSLVTARAAGRGNPWVSFRDGLSAPAQYQGPSNLVQQLTEDQTHALSIGSADFDEDGIPDLVAGYSGTRAA
jgi:hypothetical protein